MSNAITLSLKEYDRNTTKSQYKEIQSWLRSCARLIEDEATEQVIQVNSNLMIYGASVI